MEPDALKEIVKGEYRQAALQLRKGGSSCCSSTLAGDKLDPITSNLYDGHQTEGIPSDALAASFGCGNPTAVARLQPGETVLDLGSGAGIDVLLSARRVGPTGQVYGLDMTDEMLELARENQRQSGLTNVTFLKGEIEHIPLPDSSVDVIISNCVINLSGDKARVLHEAFRVLHPGGRLAIADIVVQGPVPPEIRRTLELWAGCVAGALEETEYRDLLTQAGFRDVSVEPTRVFRAEDAREFLAGAGLDVEDAAAKVDGKFMSAVIRAGKPLNR